MEIKRKIRTIDDFYKKIKKIKKIRSSILKSLLKNKKPSKRKIKRLKLYFNQLKSIEKKNNKFILTSKNIEIGLKLKYEISELEKDIIFLEKGRKGLEKYFERIHKDFRNQSKKLRNYLKNKEVDFFVTDRDGTINNYCETYLSSIQSIYNAFFLYKFSEKIKKTIILTSGPLDDFEKVNLLSKGNFIFAGSKAREFKFPNEKKESIKLSKKEEKLLSALKKSIERLLSQEKYQIHKFIGSGFQIKHGEITLARQDISNSIPKEQSLKLLSEIKKIVKELDPRNKFLEISDTKLDIEIILKSNLKSFDKGKGLEFLLKKSKINLSETLIAGDTSSDLSLLKTSKDLSKNISCIFVTEDKNLKKEVKKINKEAIFISSPDILVNELYGFSKI